MKFIDVRLRIPISKMGLLIEALPTWAAMVGYDKLEPVEGKQVRRAKPHGPNGGEYKPLSGSAPEAVLRLLKRGTPYRRFEIIAKLHKFKETATSSAIHELAKKGVIEKQEDGSYGAA